MRFSILFIRLPPDSSLFPYTTLFRSHEVRVRGLEPVVPRQRAREPGHDRSEEHTSELQSRVEFVCRLLLEKKNWRARYFTPKPAPPATRMCWRKPSLIKAIGMPSRAL